MKAKLAIGIDIGGTNTKLGIVSHTGETYAFMSFKTLGERKFPEYFEDLSQHIRELLDYKATHHKLNKIPLSGIGVGAPNANYHNGMVEAPVNLNWGTVALAQELEQTFSLPTQLDNDANTAAVGEYLFGVARGVKDFVLITLGTGVGTGIITDGKVLRGPKGKAGEGGHIIIEPNGRPCACGGKGHLEAYASSKGVEETARDIFGKEMTTYELAERITQNDPKAMKVLHALAQQLGFGSAQMCTMLNPEQVILAGGVSMLSSELANLTQYYLDQYVFKAVKGDCRVEISSICQQKGAVLGAASLILQGNS